MTYGKFASAEELLKGYNELEKSFTQKCQQLAALKAAMLAESQDGAKDTATTSNTKTVPLATKQTDTVLAKATATETAPTAAVPTAELHSQIAPESAPAVALSEKSSTATESSAATFVAQSDEHSQTVAETTSTTVIEAATAALKNTNETSDIATESDSVAQLQPRVVQSEVPANGLEKFTSDACANAQSLEPATSAAQTLTIQPDTDNVDNVDNAAQSQGEQKSAKTISENALTDDTKAPKTLASARDTATKLLESYNAVLHDGTSVETPPSSAEQSTTVDSADTVPQSEPDAPVLDGHATAFSPTESQLQQYLLNNPKIAWQLLQQTSQPPQIMTGGGNVSLALPSRPKTIKEASLMAKQLFKN